MLLVTPTTYITKQVSSQHVHLGIVMNVVYSLTRLSYANQCLSFWDLVTFLTSTSILFVMVYKIPLPALEMTNNTLKKMRCLDLCSARTLRNRMVLLPMTFSTSRMSIFISILPQRTYRALRLLLKMIDSSQPPDQVLYVDFTGYPTLLVLVVALQQSTSLNFEETQNQGWWMMMSCVFASCLSSNLGLVVTWVPEFAFSGHHISHHVNVSCFIYVLLTFAEKWLASCTWTTSLGMSKILFSGIFLMAISFIWELSLSRVDQLRLLGVIFRATRARKDRDESLPMEVVAMTQRTLRLAHQMIAPEAGREEGDHKNLMMNQIRLLLRLLNFKKIMKKRTHFYMFDPQSEPGVPSTYRKLFHLLPSVLVTSLRFNKPRTWLKESLGFWRIFLRSLWKVKLWMRYKRIYRFGKENHLSPTTSTPMAPFTNRTQRSEDVEFFSLSALPTDPFVEEFFPERAVLPQKPT